MNCVLGQVGKTGRKKSDFEDLKRRPNENTVEPI